MVKKLWRSLAAVAVFSMVGSVASAAGVLIDDFAKVSSGTTKTINASVITSSESGLGATVLGGVREALTQKYVGGVYNGSTSATATINTTGAGTLSFNFSSAALAPNGAGLSVWYDSVKDSSFGATLTPTNFVTGGEVNPLVPNTVFVLHDLKTTAAITVRVSLSTQFAYSSGIKSTDYTVASTGGVEKTSYLAFSQLTTAFPALDLTKVTRVRFDFLVAPGTDVSFSISKLSASTPEPSSVALVGIGAVGLFFAGRRRKASTPA